MTSTKDLLKQKAAETATRIANQVVLDQLPFDDRRDYENAKRGFIVALPDGVIRSEKGSVVWNLQAYQFLYRDVVPATINPSLWRMAQLNMENGLFKVTDTIYQIRGFDLANMTIIEGETGLIIVDPLTMVEVARASLDFYYSHRPRKPVRAVIYHLYSQSCGSLRWCHGGDLSGGG